MSYRPYPAMSKQHSEGRQPPPSAPTTTKEKENIDPEKIYTYSSTLESRSTTSSDESVDPRPLVRTRSWRVWVFEIVCIVTSLSSLLIIITVLNAFDGQPLPKLPMHMTLNTFLAFFTTFTKAAFMNPVVECLSQWKWNWFEHEQPLVDFDTFDKASRGFLGSVLLLKLLKWKHIATLGALISILGIATTPLTQFLIEYPSHLVPLTPEPDFPNATARSIQDYKSRVGLAGSWSLDISNYISAGLIHPTDARIEQLTPTCPSGTCTWEPFESLALCAKVANITDRIHVAQVPFSTETDWTAWDSTVDHDALRLNGSLAYNISFPADSNNSDYFVTPVSYTVYSSPTTDSIAFRDNAALSKARVAGYKIVWADAGNVTYTNGNSTRDDPWRWQAFEIIYHACVNTYSVRVENGTAITTVQSSSYEVIPPTSGDDNTSPVHINCTAPSLVSGGAQFTECIQDSRNPNLGVLTLRGDSGKNFTADIRSLTLLGKHITQDSSGIWAWDGSDHMVVAGNSGLPTMADAVYGYNNDDGEGSLKTMAGNSEKQLERLQNAASNLAVSITNGIRSIPSYESTPNSVPVIGTVLSPQVYIHVRWSWLTFLVVQLVASIVLFVCTVISTRPPVSNNESGNTPVLKSSALATLFALQTTSGIGPNRRGTGYTTFSGRDEELLSQEGVKGSVKNNIRGVRAKMQNGVMALSTTERPRLEERSGNSSDDANSMSTRASEKPDKSKKEDDA